MANESEVKVLTERLTHLTEKLENLGKTIEKLDQGLEKFKDKIENKLDQINEVKIPSITDELSALRTKAALAGGVLGTLASMAVSVILWVVETWHR